MTNQAQAIVTTINGERGYANPADLDTVRETARMLADLGAVVTLRYEMVPADRVPAPQADRETARIADIAATRKARSDARITAVKAGRNLANRIRDYKRANPKTGCKTCGGWGRIEYVTINGGACYKCGAAVTTPTL